MDIEEKVGRAMNDVQCVALETAALLCERRRDVHNQLGNKVAADEAEQCRAHIQKVADELRLKPRAG